MQDDHQNWWNFFGTLPVWGAIAGAFGFVENLRRQRGSTQHLMDLIEQQKNLIDSMFNRISDLEGILEKQNFKIDVLEKELAFFTKNSPKFI